MTRLTKQGLPDFSDPPKNSRVRTNGESCFHEWKHDSDCPCTWAVTGPNYDGKCRERCRKCGDMRLG